jgi:hypothetical protein
MPMGQTCFRRLFAVRLQFLPSNCYGSWNPSRINFVGDFTLEVPFNNFATVSLLWILSCNLGL